MTGPHVTHIFRHPIKSHGREALERVTLSPHEAMPWDRTWAVAHERSRAESGAWAMCVNFSIGSKAPGLMAIEARLDEATEEVTLTHPELGEITLHPERDAGKLIAWTRPLIPQNRAPSARVVRLDRRGWTDSDFPSVTLMNHASHRAVEQRLGQPLSIHRWRGNFWIEGLAPWEEFDLVDREVMLGTARLVVRERVERCLATAANPETGTRDADTLGALESWGHRDFSVRAEVVAGGTIEPGAPLKVL